MSIDQANQDIRALFDWSKSSVSAEVPTGESSTGGVANDDLELALGLLACNPRDREQFRIARGDA